MIGDRSMYLTNAGASSQSIRRRHPRGTTIIEILTALSIFLIIMVSMLSIFAQALVAERRALATQSALDNMRYTLEVMGRAIRQAQSTQSMSTTAACAGAPDTCFTFTHQQAAKGVVTYTYDSAAKTIQENSASTSGATVPITSSSVRVDRLRFVLNGNGPGGNGDDDGLQPTVTIAVMVSSVLNPDVKAEIQTTVSLRSPQE